MLADSGDVGLNALQSRAFRLSNPCQQKRMMYMNKRRYSYSARKARSFQSQTSKSYTPTTQKTFPYILTFIETAELPFRQCALAGALPADKQDII